MWALRKNLKRPCRRPPPLRREAARRRLKPTAPRLPPPTTASQIALICTRLRLTMTLGQGPFSLGVLFFSIQHVFFIFFTSTAAAQYFYFFLYLSFPYIHDDF